MRFNAQRFVKFFLLGLFISACLLTVACAQANAVLGEIESIVLGIIPIAAGLAGALLPAESALITAVATEAANGIKTLQKVQSDYKANPSDTTLAKVTAAVTDVQSNLAQLEAAAQVKDPASAAKITAIVNAAQLSLAAVESSINASHPATVAAAQASS